MEEVTDAALLKGVEKTFGLITIDLAATADDKVAPRYISPEEDTLEADWLEAIGPTGIGWLNPPYTTDLEERCQWMVKCYSEAICGARFLVILPAAIDSYWFWEFVQEWATIYILYPRVAYQGVETPMMLCAANILHRGAQVRDKKCEHLLLWNWITGVIK